MSKTFYACGASWSHEMGHAPYLEGSMPLYSSVELLKAKRRCWRECGIVRIKLELEGWEVPEDFAFKDVVEP